MLKTVADTVFYLQIPEESEEHILYPTMVQGWNVHGYSAWWPTIYIAPEIGQELLIFYETERGFVKQGARIKMVSKTDSITTFRFELTGDPVSAEHRECYRVSTVMDEVIATIGAEENCPVVDVSATGFAVVTSRRYRTATVVDATVHYAGTAFRGKGRIENVRELKHGRIRFGVHCISDKETGGTLQAGLPTICASVQREHLRRLREAS